MALLSAACVPSEELHQLQKEKDQELAEAARTHLILQKECKQKWDSERQRLSQEVAQLELQNQFLDPLLFCLRVDFMIGLAQTGEAV